SQVPISFTYPGEEELYLRYMQTFIQLLEECRKRKILILGISKDSVARHLSKLILNKIKIKILKTLEPALDSKELSQLSQYFETDKNEAILIRNLLRSVSISRAQYDLVWDFFHEQLRPRPDFLLINAWADTAGYTTPIEPYPDVPLFKYESKDPEAYVRRRFVNAYNNYENEHDFEKWAVPVMQDTFNLPTFVTFCAKLAHNDTPMRIDLPAFSIGLPTRISEIATSRLLVPPPRRITEVLQILRSEYGGPELYNVFLVRADQEARLPVSDVKTLYEPLVEKELKIPLIPRRRDRRVPHG
ncbi:MAG: DNA double-strand break repair nuclease NurA, partial [Candidatus Thorarchaeota archaeon]